MNRALLFGGIVGPLLYLLHDVIGAFVFEHFSFVENTISDLTNSEARGNYLLGIALLILSAMMGIGFGVGVSRKYLGQRNKSLYFAGWILAGLGLLNIFAATVFPQDPIGNNFTFNGIMHLAIVGVSAIAALFLLWLAGFSAEKGNRTSVFRRYTAVTMGLLLIGGIATGVVSLREWPILGLVERLSVYPFQAWTMAFAWRLISTQGID